MTLESVIFPGGPEGGTACFTGGGGKTALILRLAGRLRGTIVTATTKMAVSEVPPENVLLAKNFPSIFSPEFLSEIKNLLAARGAAFLFKDAAGGKYLGLSLEEAALLSEMKLAPYKLVEADGARRMPLKGYAEHEPPLPARFACQVVVVGADALVQPMNERTTARFEILRRFFGIGGAGKDAVLTPPLLLRLLTSPDMYLKNSPADVRRILCINKSDLLTRGELAPWTECLRSGLTGYQGMFVTGRREETFYELGA